MLLKTYSVTTTETETEGRLRGQFVFRDEDGEKFLWGPRPVRYEYRPVATVAEADQLEFLCPKCFDKNGGSVGTHGIMVTLAGRNVPDEACSHDADGRPTRWTASGTNLADLTLTPSILLDSKLPPSEGCHWHGFVGSSRIPPGHAG